MLGFGNKKRLRDMGSMASVAQEAVYHSLERVLKGSVRNSVSIL